MCASPNRATMMASAGWLSLRTTHVIVHLVFMVTAVSSRLMPALETPATMGANVRSWNLGVSGETLCVYVCVCVCVCVCLCVCMCLSVCLFVCLPVSLLERERERKRESIFLSVREKERESSK